MPAQWGSMDDGGDEALKMFEVMRHEGIDADGYAYGSVPK